MTLYRALLAGERRAEVKGVKPDGEVRFNEYQDRVGLFSFFVLFVCFYRND